MFQGLPIYVFSKGQPDAIRTFAKQFKHLACIDQFVGMKTLTKSWDVMSLADVVLSRRSIRSYEHKKIPEDIMKKILEAGRQAPSAGNRQPWRFVIVTDEQIKEKLSHGRWNSFIRDSAFTLVGCRYVGDAYSRKWSTVDTTIALQNMVIAAWALEIGSCWIGDFKQDEVKSLLNIPDDWKVVALISFGYPAEQPGGKWKKPLEEIANYNRF